jgi:hypothetical protein
MKKILKIYLQPTFLLCVAVLGTASGRMAWVKSHEGIRIIKKPIPLKISFDFMDETALFPYKVLGKQSITNKDVLETLGTEDYLQWTLEDTRVPFNSPVRHCSLFVTYYTGNPDQVPHVPDACYIGGGHKRVAKFSVSFNVNGLTKRQIPATGIIFTKKSREIWETATDFTVLYFFNVNGLYKGNRTDARIALGTNLKSEYSYFSKVELNFFNIQTGFPTKEEAVAAAEKLLAVVLPIFEKDHWPDLDSTD